MQGPEKVVCCSLCLCMACAVLSSVSLVYLTFIVYMPAKRELMSGLLELPVMCTTTTMRETDQCDWSSCFEWCLSKPNHCTQIWVEVRRNGSGLTWSGCSNIQDTVCPVADKELVEHTDCDNPEEDCKVINQRFLERCQKYRNCPESWEPPVFVCQQHTCVSRRETLNCKLEGECVNMEAQFLCDNGLCHNVSRVMSCQYSEVGETYDCTDKRNCIMLTGLYQCRRGQCTEVLWPWQCDRVCPGISVTPDTSLMVVSGDRTVTAECERAVDSGTGAEVWGGDTRLRHRHTLLLSCTDIFLDSEDSDSFSGLDCVNGTVLSHRQLGARAWDWTRVREALVTGDKRAELAGSGAPHTSRLVIFNRTKLFINTEMCVNTLMYECTTFLVRHRKDGRNQSSRATYQCHYNPLNSNFVAVRYDLSLTKYYFLIFFSVPAGLWIVSCSFLVTSNKILRISQTTGQMRLSCRRRSVSSTDGQDILDHKCDDDEDEELSDDNVLRERLQCGRRMAVVLD